jgi:hypothetical protein
MRWAIWWATFQRQVVGLAATIDTMAACAARACGCRAVAAEIEAKQLGPEGVARLFRLSARPDRGHIAAVVVLSGSIARQAADPDHRQDRGERDLALSLIEHSWFAQGQWTD